MSSVYFDIYTNYTGSEPDRMDHAYGLLLKFDTKQKIRNENGYPYLVGPAIFGDGSYWVAEDLGGIIIPPKSQKVRITAYVWPDYLAAGKSGAGPSGCSTTYNWKGKQCVPGTTCQEAGFGICQPPENLPIGTPKNQIFIPVSSSEYLSSVGVHPVQFVRELGKWTNCEHTCNWYIQSPSVPFMLNFQSGDLLYMATSNQPNATLNYSPGMITSWPSDMAPNFIDGGVIAGNGNMQEKSSHWDPLQYNPYATEIWLGR